MDGHSGNADNTSEQPDQANPHQTDHQPDGNSSLTPDTDESGSDDLDNEDGQHTTYVVPTKPVMVQQPNADDEIFETSNAISKKGPGRPTKQ